MQLLIMFMDHIVVLKEHMLELLARGIKKIRRFVAAAYTKKQCKSVATHIYKKAVKVCCHPHILKSWVGLLLPTHT